MNVNQKLSLNAKILFLSWLKISNVFFFLNHSQFVYKIKEWKNKRICLAKVQWICIWTISQMYLKISPWRKPYAQIVHLILFSGVSESSVSYQVVCLFVRSFIDCKIVLILINFSFSRIIETKINFDSNSSNQIISIGNIGRTYLHIL